MITEYHRPQTLDEALNLIGRTAPRTVPLGGGTLLSHIVGDPVEAVDLQALNLNQVQKKGNNLEIGATVTLQHLLENESFPTALKTALKLEAPLNIRNAATAAGSLVASDGRSTFALSMLVLDAKLTLQPKDQEIMIGDLLPLRDKKLQGRLITKIVIPLNVKVAFDYVSRTPKDKPLICISLAIWPSGRTRLALGGYGKAPILAVDGTEAKGLEEATQNALQAASDEWASAEYRIDVATTLVKRGLAAISSD